MAEDCKQKWWEKGWLLFWIIASTIWCVTASTRLSATFDEPTYVSLGLESWRTGSLKRLLDLGTMPLPPVVQTLPLYLGECWRGKLWDPSRDLEQMLAIARYGTLPFWWLLLAYGWLTGRRLAGFWGGCSAVMFLACEPNLLAHASLATTDIPLTACLLALLYHFRCGRSQTWPRRVLVPTIWFALTVLAKASGLVFGLVGLVVIEMEARFAASVQTGRWSSRLRDAITGLVEKPFRRDLCQISGLGLLAVFCFCGSDYQTSPSFVEWSHRLPQSPWRTALVSIAENLRIFSNAGVALVRQLRHNVQGHGVFLLEQVERRAIWYYFPLALSIKLPLPLLLLQLLLLAFCRRACRNWVCWVALALFGFTLVCRVQTGIRLVLPLIGLIVIGLAVSLVIARQKMTEGMWRRLLTMSGVVCSLWLLWASLSVWPHALCYTNEMWGGTASGYRCLSDSNYDWGQGLKDLARWQEEHQVHDLHVLYYGTDTTLRQLPMRPMTVGALQLGDDNLPADARGRTLAVGTSIVYGSVSETFADLKTLAHALRQRTPIDRTATFLIYRFPPEDKLAAAKK